jgi:hypothetical protein
VRARKRKRLFPRPAGQSYTQINPPTLYLERTGQQWVESRGGALPALNSVPNPNHVTPTGTKQDTIVRKPSLKVLGHEHEVKDIDITLSVSAGNTQAMSLYQRVGFIVVNGDPDADEVTMKSRFISGAV